MIYPIRSLYPELKLLPWKLRWKVVKRVCENPMSKSSVPKTLVSTGTAVGMVAMFVAMYHMWGSFSLHADYVIMLAAVLPIAPFCLAAYILKVRDDRKMFLSWLDCHTCNGRSHFCLNCWQPLLDLERGDCSNCSQRQYSFVTDRHGTALPSVRTPNETPERELPAIELPEKVDRDAISHFLLGKVPPEAEFWGCMIEPLAYGVIFGLPISIGAVIYSVTYRWYALAVAMLIIFLVVTACYRYYRTTWAQTKRVVRKYCPDGIAPWCIYCDYDLRGRVESACPECGKPIFVYDFKWRPWNRKRSRPER